MKRKDTHLTPVSCALQKIAVVPMRHPCRNVTKTNSCLFSSDFLPVLGVLAWDEKSKAKYRSYLMMDEVFILPSKL